MPIDVTGRRCELGKNVPSECQCVEERPGTVLPTRKSTGRGSSDGADRSEMRMQALSSILWTRGPRSVLSCTVLLAAPSRVDDWSRRRPFAPTRNSRRAMLDCWRNPTSDLRQRSFTIAYATSVPRKGHSRHFPQCKAVQHRGTTNRRVGDDSDPQAGP